MDKNENNLKQIANRYKDFGFNISCITNKPNLYNVNSRSYFKTPSHPWTDLFTRTQSLYDIENLDWHDSVGIGTLTFWKNLVVLDIDGCNDSYFLSQLLSSLNLPLDYEWVVQSGSRNGYHIYFYGNKIDECEEDDVVSTFPPKQQYEKYLEKIEFLWKTHVVLPPSVHACGNIYSFLNTEFPSQKPKWIDDDTIYNFITKYLDIEESETGGMYGETLNRISSKKEFIPEVENQDLTKFLMEEIYCIVDIETAGLPIKNNREIVYPEILQIAWILTNNRGTILKKNSFIVEAHSFKQNGRIGMLNIDIEVAKKVMFPMKDIMKKFVEDLKISDFVVAHNIEFDGEILCNYFLKNFGIDPLCNKLKICTMQSTVNYCRIPAVNGFKYPKLSELYFRLFNYKLTNSYNAEIDVVTTYKCFRKLKELKII